MSLKKRIGESAALDQQAKRQPRNYLQDRYCCETAEILTLFSLRGFTLRETAERLGVKYSTLKTQAWELKIRFTDGSGAIDRKHTVTYKGKEMGIKELADQHGMSWKTLSDRLRYGWTAEQAVTIPVRHGNWTYREGTDREPTGTDITSMWLRKAWKL
jgi:lambda repressor-like predicted transcriptional regulator